MLQLQSITSPLENLVLLHTMLVCSSLENYGYLRQYNTDHSVLRVNLQSVVLVMSLSHHSYQKDQVHYSNLVVRQNPAPRHILLEIISISLELQTSTLLHILLVSVLEHSVKEEMLVKHTLESSIMKMIRLVELLILLVLVQKLIQSLITNLQSSLVKKMSTLENLMAFQPSDSLLELEIQLYHHSMQTLSLIHI